MNPLELSPIELCIMVARKCTPLEARALYQNIEDILLSLEIRTPVQWGEVFADELNVRARPGMDAAIITKIPKKTKVEIWGLTSDNWAAIAKPTGWVHAGLLKLGVEHRERIE